MRLTAFAAFPRQITLAGIPMMAAPLRLIDLARVESWMADVITPPAPGEDDLPGGWPPTFDTQAGLSLISTVEGVSRLILASLGQTTPGFTLELAREIGQSMREEEFGPFFAAIFPEGTDGPAEDGPRRRINWHARINTLASVYGYTPQQILELPLDQFFALGREPEAERPQDNWEVPIGSPADLDRLWAERMARKAAGGDQS
jgi:hypothetical protein